MARNEQDADPPPAPGPDEEGGGAALERLLAQLPGLAASGLGLSLPLIVGAAVGRIDLGLIATIGGILVSGSGRDGSLRRRLVELASAVAVGIPALWLGMEVGDHGVVSSVAIVAVAVLTGLCGGIRPTAAKSGFQAIVFTILGASLAASPVPTAEKTGLLALGALAGGLLTLGAYGIGRGFALVPAAKPAPQASLRTDLRRWRAGLRHYAGWQYTLRLGTCVAAAEFIAHLRAGPHSYWIALTVALVVQRDHRAIVRRTIERGLGTVLGVLVAALLIGPLPVWVLIVAVTAIGAARPRLKTANYTAYALVMTPLIVIINELGQPIGTALLRERVLDTLVGCAISLTLGYLVWRPLHHHLEPG